LSFKLTAPSRRSIFSKRSISKISICRYWVFSLWRVCLTHSAALSSALQGGEESAAQG
jgi:hypothetical protein